MIDAEGTTILTEDLIESSSDIPPFENSQVRLNALRVSLAGAELTGSGKATDTSQGGMPSGVGELDLVLTGGNTLIDTLVDMGLLPNEDAMGARMMLGLLARPGEGTDTLISNIKIDESGAIFANGQRIK